MPESISGHELFGSVEELVRAAISSVERDKRDNLTNHKGNAVVGPFTAREIIVALQADGFEITRRK